MDHWVYKDNDYFKVWVEMLFKARFSKEPKKDIYEGSLYTLNYGEFLFSRPKWSSRLNVAEHKLRKLIKLLEEDGMLIKNGRVGKSGATIYSIKNYDKYNNLTDETPALPVENSSVEGDSDQPNANEAPTKRQPNANETPLKKNVKNVKKVKNVFIPPTLEEVQTYITEMDYQVDAKYFYNYYTNTGWVKNNGNSVENWKNTIGTWHKKEIEKQKSKQTHKGIAPATNTISEKIEKWS